MSLILQSLPYEIVELISNYTSTSDLTNAILVSKSWYHFFQTYLYKSLTMDNYEKQHRVLLAFQSEQLPGHYVRSLDMIKIELSLNEIESLPKLFPNIDTLVLDWNIWGPHSFSSYFDSKAPVSFIHPPQGLPPFIFNFFNYYGSRHLKSLSIDTLNNESTDIWSILALCPHLRHLELFNLNHEHIITLGYIETIHQYCPKLTSLTIKCNRSDPNPALLPQFIINNHDTNPILLRPTLLLSFSLSSKSGSAKWPLWLPYFSVKYPHLQHILFKHCGLGKDGGGIKDVPEKVYTLFTHGCRQLKSMRWNKIIVQHDQQKGLFSTCSSHHKEQKQPFLYLERIEAYENFLIPESIQCSPIVQSDTLMSNLLTSLTIGQPPANVTTSQVIRAIGQCKNLSSLKVQECFVDPNLAYSIDDILIHCRGLHTLYFKDVHVNVGQNQCITEKKKNHPLRKLILKRSSFIQPVFEHISNVCTKLNHVEILACFQTDRRDQVIINLPSQSLTTLKIQGLRTRSYYAGCRIRFFSLKTQHEPQWYYMSQYDIRSHPVGRKVSFQKYRNMEFARKLDRLDQKDVQQLQPLVTNQTLKAWDIEAVKQNLSSPHTLQIDPSSWDPENIYYSGIVSIHCHSVQNLTINNKLIIN